MKKNSFILSFFSSILCIYLLHLFWSLVILLLLNSVGCSKFLSILEFLSPFISYWILKKYFSNNIKIQDVFLNYPSIKKYALILLFVESLILLLLIIIGMDFASIIFIYLVFLVHYFSFIWYLPFLILAYINKKEV